MNRIIRQLPLLSLFLGAMLAGDLAAARLGDQVRLFKEGATHWSFQPVRRPNLPAVKQTQWVRNGLDRFILAELERTGLEPAPEATPTVLIRRLFHNLIGLPPGYAEVRKWTDKGVGDELVGHLLKSPHHGERWARHWLDVARYADTKGYMPASEEKRYPFAYTYRDWVVRAFNEDIPYDRFIRLQLAADKLLQQKQAGTNDLAALGFLTVGSRFSNKSDLIIDDRIDVVTRGTMGLTVTCARCHDHMFDPIPTADYYSLYGVFQNTTEPAELPRVARIRRDPKAEREFQLELAKREAVVFDFLKEHHDRLRQPEWIAKYMQFAVEHEGVKRSDALSAAGKLDLHFNVVARWTRGLQAAAKTKLPVLAPWHAAAKLFKEGKTGAARAALKKSVSGPPETVNRLVAEALTKNPPASLKELATIYGRLLAEADAAEPHADKDREALRAVLNHPAGPTGFPVAEMRRYLNRAANEKRRRLQAKVDKLIVESPGSPPRAMVVNDLPRMRNSYVHKRGQASQRGAKVPRQFLAILEGDQRKPFSDGSGRLELAERIVARDNPLTARVIVNRLWQHHFGKPLVETPSDFGLQTPRPLHAELLDWLAAELMDNGWSLRHLHRLIVNSATFRQSSRVSDKAWNLDPANRRWSRAESRRLEFEAMRDALLVVSGELDRTIAGRPEPLEGKTPSKRRALYGFIDRYSVAPSLRTFDFADPNLHAPKRPETTVPQQALFFMNSTFTEARARHLAAAAKDAPPDEFVTFAYRRILARDPEPDERRDSLAFLGDAGLNQRQSLAQALLAANEFAFVD